MAMLFSVLLTYGRMSQDSEIVAFKALGLGMRHLLTPALVMGVVVTILAAQLTINVAPWGSRKSEELAHEMRQFQPMAAIREGVFSEGFFDLVVYFHLALKSSFGFVKNTFVDMIYLILLCLPFRLQGGLKVYLDFDLKANQSIIRPIGQEISVERVQ